MSREIKFRAWNREKGRMFRIARFDFSDYTIYSHLFACDGFLGEVCEIMQCTGLKGYMNDAFNDCEQKDVYQGDHITIAYDGYYGGFYAEEKYSGVVDLDDTGTAFVLRNADYERQGGDIPNKIGDMEISFSFPDDDDLEQIYLHAFELVPYNIIINGNIYENPELLKEQ